MTFFYNAFNEKDNIHIVYEFSSRSGCSSERKR